MKSQSQRNLPGCVSQNKNNPDAGLSPGSKEAAVLVANSAKDNHIAKEAETIRDHFSGEYYLRHNADVADVNIDPLLHFLNYGWREGRNPNEWFSVGYYLDSNPDIREAGINPFWHYVVAGKAEGRAPAHVGAIPTNSADDIRISQEAQAIRSEFDFRHYLRHNSDVADANIDPLTHFLLYGWKEGRNPNASFSIDYYLEANPDIREAGINPFWHYVVAGKAEGRSPRHPGGHRAETLIHAKPLEEIVKAWRSKPAPERLLTAEDLCRRVESAREKPIRTLIISVGHDDYRAASGGVQYCIQHEEEAATERGIVYLNLHPYQPLPRLAHAHAHRETDVPVSLLLGGRAIGIAPMSAVTRAARLLAQKAGRTEVVIHHLLGHSPEMIADMVHATGTDRCWLWLHDFFTLCPNFVLQRNDVSFCGAPPNTSNACRLCLYGSERTSHLDRMSAFFKAIDVHIVAPSQFVADFWTARTSLRTASMTVLPHATLEWTECERAPVENRKITVAFVGYPATHKGWPVFESIVHTFRDHNSDFDFVYFGTNPIELGVDTVHVHVTADEPDAMIRALAERGVDFVLHWASWGETFSFSTHEALASGAYVLTNAGSGNVAATVRRLERGVVLADEGELDAFLRDGRATAMAAELRAKRRTERAIMKRSNMSLDVLRAESHR